MADYIMILEGVVEIIENLDANQQIALISAGAALLGAIVGAIATLASTWLNKKVQISGKVSIYAKIVYSKGNINKTWGYYGSTNKPGLYMQVPTWLDVCNTCGVSRILRNVNLYAYAGKDEIASFTQIQRTGNGENAILLGDNGSYTLVIPANCARRFDMQFMLYEMDLSAERKIFDALILTYFDEKNNIHAFCFAKPNNCWVEGPLKFEKQWITLDEKFPYSR